MLVKLGQTLVKLLIQEVLVLLNNYECYKIIIIVFLNFGQILSNYGQTMVKLLIQEILVSLNNY